MTHIDPACNCDDLCDFIENFLCNFHNSSIFSAGFEAGLNTFLEKYEIPELISKKREFLDSHSKIDDKYLLKLTGPLYLTRKYQAEGGYLDYLSNLAYEIREYKALELMRVHLQTTFEQRFKDPETKKKVQGIFPNFKRIPRRPKDKLYHQFLMRTDMIAEKYLKSVERRYFQEELAYILAKTDAMPKLMCPYKTSSFKCSSIDCISARLQAIEMTTCIDNCDLNLCADCPDKKKCPSFYPCPPGVKRYKTSLHRKKTYFKG